MIGVSSESPDAHQEYDNSPGWACAELLAQALVFEQLLPELSISVELRSRLKEGLPMELRQAVVRRVKKALGRLSPEPPNERDDFFSWPMPAEVRLEFLRQAILREETITICYSASGQSTPETRWIMPLILKTHGRRFYLTAPSAWIVLNNGSIRCRPIRILPRNSWSLSETLIHNAPSIINGRGIGILYRSGFSKSSVLISYTGIEWFEE